MTRPAPTGPLADALARFPLVPRPDPGAPPLEQRVAELAELAAQATATGDTGLATAVYHRAAVLAHDRGHPGAAYGLCDFHAHLYLAHRPLSVEHARQALELQLTAVELLIREGRGQAALDVLAEVARAIGEDADADLAAKCLPLAGLVTGTPARGDVYEWWDGAHLAHGARALVSEGRWTEAHLHIKGAPEVARQPGLFEARQIGAVAMALAGQPNLAALLIDTAPPGDLWEQVVAAELTVACAQLTGGATTEQITAMLDAHGAYRPARLPLFDVQLILTAADLCTVAAQPDAARRLHEIATGWTLEASEGYSAQALLRHALTGDLPDAQQRELTAITEHAGLRTALVPPDLDEQITAALAQAAKVITTAVTAARPALPRP
ncbi:hypothetical protein GCM10009759_03680 [Kitasatospora saccharophila]|uniref:Uncharacterized protein n=1 Tax=Kitasatospora saccharophila TaxID=407973 RepID=A0ABN2W6X0_9ACTN